MYLYDKLGLGIREQIYIYVVMLMVLLVRMVRTYGQHEKNNNMMSWGC